MSDASRVSIPGLRPELLTQPWSEGSGEAPKVEEPPASRPAAVLRRIRKRAKLIRRRSMPLLGGTLLLASTAGAWRR